MIWAKSVLTLSIIFWCFSTNEIDLSCNRSRKFTKCRPRSHHRCSLLNPNPWYSGIYIFFNFVTCIKNLCHFVDCSVIISFSCISYMHLLVVIGFLHDPTLGKSEITVCVQPTIHCEGNFIYGCKSNSISVLKIIHFVCIIFI